MISTKKEKETEEEQKKEQERGKQMGAFLCFRMFLMYQKFTKHVISFPCQTKSLNHAVLSRTATRYGHLNHIEVSSTLR